MTANLRPVLLAGLCCSLLGCAQIVRQHYYSPAAEGGVGERTSPRYYSDLGTPAPNEVLIHTEVGDFIVSVRDFGDFSVSAGLILPIVPSFPLELLTPLMDPVSTESMCMVPWRGRLPMTSYRFRRTERLTVQIRIEAIRPLTAEFGSAMLRAPSAKGDMEPEWAWIYDTRRDLESWITVIHSPHDCERRYPSEPLPLRLGAGEHQTVSVLYRVPLEPPGSFEVRLPRIESGGAQIPLPGVRFERAAAWSYEVGHL